ncbi:alpha/beta fold hydrolase [Bacillus sp. AK128]
MKVMTINNEKMAYEDVGSGKPIIFIHPPGMGRKVFDYQRPLSSQYRLILPDLMGQGDSSYDRKSQVTVKRFAEDIIQLMDDLKIDKAVIFGYSAGGIISQYLGIHYSDRVEAIIMSGAYPIVDNVTFKTEHKLGIYAINKSKKFLSTVLAISHTKDKHFRKVLKEHMLKSNSKVWSDYYEESLQFNCKNDVSKMKMPVLIFYGSKADHINTYQKLYKEQLSNIQIHIVKGESHQVPTRRPEEVNKIVTKFLNELKE